MKFHSPVHPGEILKGELDELGITPTDFANQISMSQNQVSRIIAGEESITGDMALRLGRWFDVEPQFWTNLQTQHDLAQSERRIGDA